MSTHDIEAYFVVAFDYIGGGRYGMAIFETNDYCERENSSPTSGHFELIHKETFSSYEDLNDFGEITANKFISKYRVENFMNSGAAAVGYMCPPAFEALSMIILKEELREELPPIDKPVNEKMEANDKRLAYEMSAVIWE